MPSIHRIFHTGRSLYISYSRRNQHLNQYCFCPNSNVEGIRFWNHYNQNNNQPINCRNSRCNSTHYRKFMEHEGEYVTRLNPTQSTKDTLRFWGEYEGFSKFRLLGRNLNNTNHNNPCAVHFPFYYPNWVNRGSTTPACVNCHNTDPFIFGDYFYYAFCLKNQLNIQPGDIVIFGSRVNQNDFVLDTLFVIDGSMSVHPLSQYDTIYQESTLIRAYGNVTANNAPTMPVHIGKKFTPNNGIFSFVPARAKNNAQFSRDFNTGFGRPIITNILLCIGFSSNKQGQGAQSIMLTIPQTKCVWEQIATEVLRQGFVLGTHFDALSTVGINLCCVPSTLHCC